MYTQETNLNVIPSGVRPVIHCSQYDNNLSAIRFKLYKDNAEFTIPSGAAVIINGYKPDNTGFSYAASAISGNIATMDVTQQMTAIAGDVLCELRVRTESQIIGTLNFVLRVEPAPLTDDTIISETDIPLIEQAVDIAANLAEYIQVTYDNAAAAKASAESSASSATSAATSAASAASDAASVQELYDSIDDAKTAANAAAANANAVAADVQAKLDSGAFIGPQGPQGPQGPAGDGGIITEIAGFFTMWVNDAGDLYVSAQTDLSDMFHYDEETGNLYYVTEDGEE